MKTEVRRMPESRRSPNEQHKSLPQKKSALELKVTQN